MDNMEVRVHSKRKTAITNEVIKSGTDAQSGPLPNAKVSLDAATMESHKCQDASLNLVLAGVSTVSANEDQLETIPPN